MAYPPLASRVRQAVHANPTKTYAEIAEIVGCSISTVTKYSPGRNTGIPADLATDDVSLEPAERRVQPSKPIPLRRVASLLGKSVGVGNVCSPDAPIAIERDETGTTYTLAFVPKTKASAEFFSAMDCLIRVRDTSNEACGHKATRYTTLGRFKTAIPEGLNGVLRSGNHLKPAGSQLHWREPDDSEGLWDGDAPTHGEFAEMIAQVASATFTNKSENKRGGDRPALRMATITGPKSRFKGTMVTTDSYRLVVARPPQDFAVTGIAVPVQPIQKFVDLAAAAKQTLQPVEITVGNYDTVTDEPGPHQRPSVTAPRTTTLRCGNVAVQATMTDDDLADPRNMPNIDKLLPQQSTEAFEIADPPKLAKWLIKNMSKNVENTVVLKASKSGKKATVEMLSVPDEATTPKQRRARVDATNPDGASQKPADWAQPDRRIGFNPRYLADALRQAGKRTPVSISMSHEDYEGVSALKPVVITPKGPNPNIDVLLMPTRVPQ